MSSPGRYVFMVYTTKEGYNAFQNELLNMGCNND